MAYWQGKVAPRHWRLGRFGPGNCPALVQSGAKVAIAARGAEDLERAAAELQQRGGDVLAIVADVTQDADVERMARTTSERFGRLDVVAHCAGRSARGEVLATTPEEFRQMLELNLLGAVRVTRAVVPHLLESQGHLILVGSLASKSAARFLGAYPASKFALAAYAQQLRLELGPKGLKVLLACPGPIAREQTRDYLPADSSLPASATHRGRASSCRSCAGAGGGGDLAFGRAGPGGINSARQGPLAVRPGGDVSAPGGLAAEADDLTVANGFAPAGRFWRPSTIP